MLVAIVAGLLVTRGIAVPLSNLTATAAQIAAGNLELEAPVEREDEVGMLSRAFNQMTTQLRDLIESLEQRVAERTAELVIAKEQAEAANQAKSDFLVRMSHEIRTPLNAVTGLTNIVLKSELTAEQRDYLNKVQIASNNLLEVINDILDFSKVEAGRLELTHAPFDLDQVLEQLADLFSNRVAQKDLELIFAVAPQVPRQLMGDSGRLTQVLTNLVENAVKFTDKGEIVVRVKIDEGRGTKDKGGPVIGDQVILRSMKDEERGVMDNEQPANSKEYAVRIEEKTNHQSSIINLQFEVSDTGIGIAADVLPTLFDPFTQAEGYLTRIQEGTGLGLAICRRLVELMGGTIETQSTPGQGSTFSFTVLLEARKEEKSRFSVPADLRGLKTLVVDDSASARQVLVDLLESFNFNVSALDSGEKAIEALRRVAAGEPYQLVLMDWRMPGMDGIDTARRIREWEASRCQVSGVRDEEEAGKSETRHLTPDTLIVILVTAYGHELVQERIDTAAVDTLLLKPVKASQLFNTIMALFGQAEAMVPRDGKPRAARLDQLAGRRVLVVEDSELNRDVAVALLAEAGLEVEIAENGQVAVEKVTRSSGGYYDAVFMDIQMPVMDGYEATRRIRAYEADFQSSIVNRQSSIPIVALTAHALKGEKEKCLKAGMDDYIAKPIDEKQLFQVLVKWAAPGQVESPRSEARREASRLSEPPSLDRPAVSDTAAVLDVREVLKRLGGRKNIYLVMLKTFEPECGKADETIRRCLAAGDMETAERTAHSVKGTAASIGATALYDAALNLEKAIFDKGPDIDGCFERFKKELDNALETVSEFVATEQKQQK
jgi:two-component system sensor histidine kinase/response regulator